MSFAVQWGNPPLSAATTRGFLSAVLVGIVESLGEYKAVARIVNAPLLPEHSANRGIFIEAIGCILCGIFGTGNGPTSYSRNTGTMSVTCVGSRRVVQVCGILMIFLSLSGKIGGFFASIPEPIVGGIFTVNFALIIRVRLSNLQKVDLTSLRNNFTVGLSLFIYLVSELWKTK